MRKLVEYSNSTTSTRRDRIYFPSQMRNEPVWFNKTGNIVEL